jgi:hypothetical protein
LLDDGVTAFACLGFDLISGLRALGDGPDAAAARIAPVALRALEMGVHFAGDAPWHDRESIAEESLRCHWST